MAPVIRAMLVIIFVLSSASAEVITPHSNISDACGPKIKTNAVMVLDLESFGQDHASARSFVKKHE